ncbi:phage tail protein [Megasphaera sp. WILCCON 0056]|uniref:phage tail protein n=1 Tax=Megasphaera sp. WILCCON 0056 TaxID=3345340 RepID=UPI003A7FD655
MGIFRGHTTTIRGNKIADFTVSTAEYGAPVPEILGTTRVSGNVIYYDDFTAHEHRETQRSGKGGHSKTVTVSYTYTVAVLMGLCEGPINGVKRVWVGKEIYNYPDSNIQMTLWKGSQDQKPWAYVTGKHPDKALPYPGLAYMAGVIDLGDSGSMPNYNFEVAGKLLDTGDGVDVNPADYIRYVLDKVGLSNVEIIGLDNYRKYCAAADLLISTPPDETQSKSARDIINEIATLTNAYVFWSNDTFKIVPLDDRTYDTWTPNRTILYNLTADDFIPQSGGALVTYQRKDSSEVYNQFPVEFINRANGYEKETVSYAVTDDIVDYGLRQASTTQAHYFYTKERAVKLAESLARNGKYSRNKYTFKLDWSFCRLEVGDLVTLTDVNCGLNKQVVLIDSVTEGTDGLLTFTAISRPDGEYSEATYDVHETDRPYINYNQPAPDTAKPVILQPPADLTQNGLELWIGAKGTADMWGGCDVFVSDDNEHYRLAGQITNTARIGNLAAAVAKDATTIEVAVNGTLLSGSEQDAQRGNTLCWLDGECLSYQTANLLTNGHWQLTGCIRGQYNTSAVAHAAGVPFARLDATLLHVPFRKEDVGKKIWLKFASYNIFGSGNQSLADVKAYEYTIMAYYIPPVSDLRAYNRYRQMPDGVARYDLVATWTPPELQSYLSGEVWYKTDHQQAQNVTIKEGTAADKAGFDGEWIFGGSGKNQVVIPQAVVGDTYRICVCTKDEWGVSTSPDTAPSVDILVAMRTEIPNTPGNVLITFGVAAVVSWNEVTNTDVAFYEIRTDQYPGRETDAMLARTTDTSCTVSLSIRTGKLYVYVKSAVGKYSAPAIITYNKPVPVKPDAPVVTPKLGGLSIVAQSVPTDCIGVRYYINSAVISSVNNQLAYTCDAGIYDVTVAFYDLFGVGPQSPTTRCVVKALVDSSLLADQAVTRQKVDQVIDKAVQDTQTTLPQQIQAAAASAANDLSAVITELNKAPGDSSYKSISDLKTTTDGLTSTFATQKTAQDKVNASVDTQISQIKQDASMLSSTVQSNKTAQDKVNSSLTSKITQTSDAVTTVVSNLNDSTKAKSYSAIAQMSNAIATKITQGDMTSYLQQDHTGFYIKGSLINIDGTTKIGNNIITNNMIQSNAVTADKINVNSLSAITATIGTLRTKTSGARVEIKDNLIEVYDNNNVLRVKMGVW